MEKFSKIKKYSETILDKQKDKQINRDYGSKDDKNLNQENSNSLLLRIK